MDTPDMVAIGDRKRLTFTQTGQDTTVLIICLYHAYTRQKVGPYVRKATLGLGTSRRGNESINTEPNGQIDSRTGWRYRFKSTRLPSVC